MLPIFCDRSSNQNVGISRHCTIFLATMERCTIFSPIPKIDPELKVAMSTKHNSFCIVSKIIFLNKITLNANFFYHFLDRFCQFPIIRISEKLLCFCYIFPWCIYVYNDHRCLLLTYFQSFGNYWRVFIRTVRKLFRFCLHYVASKWERSSYLCRN